jgi:hypothetical protein
MGTLVTKLKVDDEDFLIASLIERCPKVMMLRELVQNALEAAIMAPAGQRKVLIGATLIDGVRKLTIRNTGPGLSGAELHRMCDLAASIGKLKALDGNFGMGAKVASLPSNPLGMRYRSCREGRVNEVTIGKRNGVYGRIWRAAPGSSKLPGMERMVDIADVTALAAEDGLPLDHDWTEVVLYGSRPEQDTVIDPYDGDPQMPENWLSSGLYARFFRMAGGVDVTIMPGLQPHAEPRRFAAIAERASTVFERYEAVRLDGGIVIHYLYDPPHPKKHWVNLSAEDAVQPAVSTGAIVYRDEIYDNLAGSPWAYNGPIYGITFGAKHVSVYVELPATYPVIVDGYRQFLRYKIGPQEQLQLKDFARMIRVNCPGWLAKIVRPAVKNDGVDIDRELGELVERLGLSTKPGEDGKAQIALPVVVPLHDKVDIRHRWMDGRAACYYPETNELLVNLTYYSVGMLQAQIEAAFKDHAGSAPVSAWAREVAELALIRRVSRALVFAMSKHSQSELWLPEHIEKAMAPESLSIAGDDTLDSLPWAWKIVSQRIKQAMAMSQETSGAASGDLSAAVS